MITFEITKISNGYLLKGSFTFDFCAEVGLYVDPNICVYGATLEDALIHLENEAGRLVDRMGLDNNPWPFDAMGEEDETYPRVVLP
jgi:hypothetical protein